MCSVFVLGLCLLYYYYERWGHTPLSSLPMCFVLIKASYRNEFVDFPYRSRFISLGDLWKRCKTFENYLGIGRKHTTLRIYLILTRIFFVIQKIRNYSKGILTLIDYYNMQLIFYLFANFSHLNLKTIMWDGHCYSNFTEETGL
jgi:hypothetical protein